MFLSYVHIKQNYHSFEANSFRDSFSIKKFEFHYFVGPDWVQTVCIGCQQKTKVVTGRLPVKLLTLSLLHTEQTFFCKLSPG